jgi:hypothetical protein
MSWAGVPIRASALLHVLSTEVRGIRILRTSPFGHSAKFAYTAFSEVRKEKVVINTAIE